MISLRNKILFALLALTFLAYACSDSGTGPDIDPEPQFNSKAAPGDSAKSFLESDQYTSLEIEIDYMEGYEPTQEGLNSLKTFLEERLNKNSISFTTTQIAAGGQSSYTTEDISAIEEEQRDNYTETGSSTLHAYFLIVDGEYSDSNVLGIAYWNTSMAFFGQTIEDISGTPPTAPSRQQVEGTVFRHEVGHNMGLVGNGTPTQSDHKTSGSAHCTTDGCLMEPAVETGNIFQNFNGEVPNLDQLCIEDLQANGGK
ncbi:peptidase [Balneolaceae bacterium YR4-1]|uniref:Peptidase n=1 Tax=Halalkalibaculum roseum TaxID=2709311 RepID=A0A6M1TC09_9BACT|nr:peptidase [Halalkalibaculum roseum]NGP77663.1 peptidase [Halalkalibaculum roseum]